jgi:hypothetical protein
MMRMVNVEQMLLSGFETPWKYAGLHERIERYTGTSPILREPSVEQKVPARLPLACMYHAGDQDWYRDSSFRSL